MSGNFTIAYRYCGLERLGEAAISDRRNMVIVISILLINYPKSWIFSPRLRIFVVKISDKMNIFCWDKIGRGGGC